MLNQFSFVNSANWRLLEILHWVGPAAHTLWRIALNFHSEVKMRTGNKTGSACFSDLLAFFNLLDQQAKDMLLAQISQLDFAQIEQWQSQYILNDTPAKLPENIIPAPSYPPQPADENHREKYDQARCKKLLSQTARASCPLCATPHYHPPDKSTACCLQQAAAVSDLSASYIGCEMNYNMIAVFRVAMHCRAVPR